MIIYKITNKVNNKIYIGQTVKSLRTRFNGHCSTKSNTYIASAIKKYGKDSFSIEQIDSASSAEELNAKEEYWIRFYNSLDRTIGYNIKKGGESHRHSESTKILMKKIKSNISDETRLKMSIASRNRVVKEETIEKMRKTMTGRVRSPEHCRNLSIAQRGKVISEESKAKMRSAKRKTGEDRAPVTNETRAKISEKLKGKVVSEIARSNMRKARLKWLQTNKDRNAQ